MSSSPGAVSLQEGLRLAACVLWGRTGDQCRVSTIAAPHRDAVLHPSVPPALSPLATSERSTASLVWPFPERHIFGTMRRGAVSDRPLPLGAVVETPP